MKFSSQDFAPELQQAIDACGYSEMTPIQQQAIPSIRRGKDVLANAQTGTGKSAAFALPILQKLIDKPVTETSSSPRALVLTPTRELSEQLANTIKEYAQFLPFSVTSVYGGGKMSGQAAKLKAGTDILIATPGRLLEHISLCNVDLAKVEFVVLDEADRMLDMGFITDVQKLIQYTSSTHQTMLFSATISHAVSGLAHKILKNHVVISAAKQNITADTIEHVMYPVEERRKVELFLELFKQYNWFQVLVFTSTKEQADRLMGSLQQQRIEVAVCHGDIKQGARRRALADFKSTKLQVLIATEVAARGLDIKGLDYVVNFNLPYLPEDYVHRIGRTGRAGNKGTAISLVSREEEHTVAKIEKLIGNKIKRVHHADFEVSNRDVLIKNIHAYSKTGRTNKATQTQIERASRFKRGKLES
ncbi:DEAD/DEAH box helicase [Psychrosphaera sp. 1_MG-2023]|uniref:DEAD/DEAH box helicase n=1 Tax=Psychrosphaera sp. 1_MG-2023 TaxID=3062643 RepID=UPI0026E3B9F3|nr:DEAD/DEAH box helicase [Psychrosphaera sp. 1_MG-2023]MDO6721494.1 DEAD/DEAH box helicase [Psychrosphaera sp. 1_MG-2023]